MFRHTDGVRMKASFLYLLYLHQKHRLRDSQLDLFAVYEVPSEHIIVPKRQSLISFSGFSLSLVLGEWQLQINRVHSSPADLWANTWAHAQPQLLTHFLPSSFWSAEADLLVLPLYICLSLCLFPYLCFCMMSICDSTVLHTLLSDTLMLEARFLKLSCHSLSTIKTLVKTPLSASVIRYETTFILPLSLLTQSDLYFKSITTNQSKLKM